MQTKIILSEDKIPSTWYNVQADLPEPLPPLLHPGTGEPTILPPFLFPDALNEQEFSTQRYIDIPGEVLDVLRLWRPTPIFRAHRLEKALGTPARIYYKHEGFSPAGSHKPNTAVAQAYYNKKQGVKRLATETGAGQWGSALSMACQFFDLECKVYMVRISYNQKPYRRILMETWGASVVPSPSPDTNYGRTLLEQDPDPLGSLGIAISEAVEDAATHDDTMYSLGSVLNHVLMHQTIIGEEAQLQLESVDDYPDIVIGCIGGGSNYAGAALPFVRQKLAGTKDTQFIACEATACPSTTRGIYAYDYGDTAKMAPIAKMHTLGHTFVPTAIHAGGLRYHGMAPIISYLVKSGIMESRAYQQNAVFDAAVLFARTEGHLCAPETAHALRATIDEALKCKETGQSKSILVAFSGHGHFDLAAYDAYLNGKLEDYEYPEAKIQEALKDLPQVSL